MDPVSLIVAALAAGAVAGAQNTPRLFVESLDDITEYFAPGLVPPPSCEP